MMMLCKKSEISPHHTHKWVHLKQPVPTWSINSTDSFHDLNCIYILLHIHGTVIKETLQFPSSWSTCFYFRRQAHQWKCFPSWDFSVVRGEVYIEKNAVGCVFIIKRPNKEQLSRSKMAVLWRFSITFAPLRKCEAWIQDPCTHSRMHTLSDAHKH